MRDFAASTSGSGRFNGSAAQPAKALAPKSPRGSTIAVNPRNFSCRGLVVPVGAAAAAASPQVSTKPGSKSNSATANSDGDNPHNCPRSASADAESVCRTLLSGWQGCCWCRHQTGSVVGAASTLECGPPCARRFCAIARAICCSFKPSSSSPRRFQRATARGQLLHPRVGLLRPAKGRSGLRHFGAIADPLRRDFLQPVLHRQRSQSSPAAAAAV
jgi:hypothetical protein